MSNEIESKFLMSTILKSALKFWLQNCLYNVCRINAYRYLQTQEMVLQDESLQE